jgi:hypothetical protein
VPAGASLTPPLPQIGNPAGTTFNWTPTAADPGDHVITFTATDRCGLRDSCKFNVQVITNRPPDCTGAVAAEPVLWPPDHRYHPVNIVGVTDPDGDPMAITVTSVTQDEPANGRGDGNTCPDAQIVDGRASVRAERAGTRGLPGNGRVYAIGFVATDNRGASCAGVVHVCVPHDAGDPSCVDDGQRYNSLGPCETQKDMASESVRLDVGEVTGATAGLTFSLPAESPVDLSVFDVSGRRLATVERGTLPQGEYARTWDMGGVSNGVFFVRLRAGATTLTRTVVRAR